MKRRSSLSVSIALLLALAALSAMIAGRIAMELSLVPDLDHVEEVSARRDADRVQHVIEADLVAVDGTNGDYAPWSETIQFIQGTKPGYTAENFDLAFFTGQRLTHVVIFDNQGQAPAAISLAKGQLAPIPAEDIRQVAADLAGVTLPSTGILELSGDRALLYSARPVQVADKTSPAVGVIVMMRALDAAYVQKIDRTLDLTVTMQPVAPGSISAPRTWLEPQAAAAETVLREPPGRADLLVIVRAPRGLASLTDDILQHTTIIIAMTALLTGVVIWGLANFHLLRPIRGISLALRDLHDDKAPAMPGNISPLLPVKRGDEVGEIAGEIVAMHRRIIDLAQRDPLTGCPNRGLFADRVGVAIAKAQRSGGSFLLLYIDLNKFKPVNDRHGHAAGDAVLVETSRRLRQQLRAGDTVARLGGDEFAILIDGPQGLPDIAALIARLAEAVAQPISFEGLELRISASIGQAIYPVDGASLDALTAAADQRMYAAKSRDCAMMQPVG